MSSQEQRQSNNAIAAWTQLGTLDYLLSLDQPQRYAIYAMAFSNYTRELVLKALDKLARPAHDNIVFAKWLEIADLEKVKEVECIKTMPGLDIDAAIRLAFFAAVVDMIEQKILCTNTDGLLCFTEWLPDPKRMRSVDDEWTS